MSERPGRGVLHQIFSREVWHKVKKMDLKFCKNEQSIRSKTNEKVGQLDKNSRQKLIQNP